MLITSLLIAVLQFSAKAQTIAPAKSDSNEKVYIQCNQSVIEAGDTLWWKAYVIAGKHFSANSTNLYMELFTDSGRLISRSLFPVFNGQAIGQANLSDSLASGIYWLRFFTGYQQRSGTEPTIIPVTVFHEQDKKLIVAKRSADRVSYLDTAAIAVQTDTVNTSSHGYNSCLLHLKDTGNYFYSCVVSDADLPSEGSNGFYTPVSNASTDTVVAAPDTAFLQWHGLAVRENGKTPVKNKSLYVMLVKGNNILMQDVIPVNASGRFSMEHLLFFGQLDLQFQLNEKAENAKNVKLVFDPYTYPAFHIPVVWNKRDTLALPEKLVNQTIVSQNTPGRIKGRVLKEVKIKGWKNPRKELDSVYTQGLFSEPALYAFDLRNEKYDFGLGGYLRMHLFTQGGYSASDTPSYPGHQLLYYVNEELKTWDQISDLRISDIAYIKAFESEFIGNDPFTKFITGIGGFSLGGGGALKSSSQPTPMIVSIYTSKGKDIKPIPGLNSIAITGYTPILKFPSSAERRATLLWEPLLTGNNVRIRFINNGTARHFRITVMGFSSNGRPLYYTTVILGQNLINTTKAVDSTDE